MVSYADGGTFGIHAGTGPQQVSELIPVIADEFHKLTSNISDQEVIRAKAQIKAGILMSLENTTSRMEQLGRQQMIYGRHVPREEILSEIENVDVAAIKGCAARILSQSKLSIGAVGPLSSLPDYGKISSQF